MSFIQLGANTKVQIATVSAAPGLGPSLGTDARGPQRKYGPRALPSQGTGSRRLAEAQARI